MKKLIIISLILFVSSSFAYSAPNYDPNYKTCVYDDSYNTALFNKLDKEYNNKCWVQIAENHYNNICGTDSYYRMVMQPYVRQMQRFDYDTCQPIND